MHKQRLHIVIRGAVQGVGFRPFVYQLARRFNLRGWVCNTSEDVRIEVEGGARGIEGFLSGLRDEAPALAHIEDITATAGDPAGYDGFEIRGSIAEAGKYQLVSPDFATSPTACGKSSTPPTAATATRSPTAPAAARASPSSPTSPTTVPTPP